MKKGKNSTDGGGRTKPTKALKKKNGAFERGGLVKKAMLGPSKKRL